MAAFSSEEARILVQYAIQKYGDEEELLEKLRTVLGERQIQQTVDFLIGTQKVRRIGPQMLQNNESHTELPDLPDGLKPVIDGL